MSMMNNSNGANDDDFKDQAEGHDVQVALPGRKCQEGQQRKFIAKFLASKFLKKE